MGGWRPVVSAALLLFIFFLPLHVHVVLAAPLAKECACIHGQRTQLALHTAAPAIAPPLHSVVIAVPPVSFRKFEKFFSQVIRGPPVSLLA